MKIAGDSWFLAELVRQSLVCLHSCFRDPTRAARNVYEVIRTARTDKGYATNVSSGFMRHQCLTALAPWITVPPTLASPVMYGRPSRSQSAPMTESIDRQLVSGCDAHSPVSAVNAVRHVRLVALWHASGRSSAYI